MRNAAILQKGHGVSLLTNMSFLKYRYMAKAIYEQEAKLIANAALRRVSGDKEVLTTTYH